MDTNPFTGRSVLVCLQHTLTEEQNSDLTTAKSVVLLKNINSALFARVANIDPEIDSETLKQLADEFNNQLLGYDIAILPIGSPEFQATCAVALVSRHYDWAGLANPPSLVYARSRRESVDEAQSDGSVVKRAVFKHAGWGTVSF